MAERIGGEGPAPHTPQQQQLYAETHAAYSSGPACSYLTENSFGPALRCPHCNTFLWKDSEGRFLPCTCQNYHPDSLYIPPDSGPFRCACGNLAQLWRGDDVCGAFYCESCYPEQRNHFDRRACTVCGHPDGPSVIYVWYDTLRDRVCGDCFAWATAKMKIVKLQRMYRNSISMSPSVIFLQTPCTRRRRA